MVLPRWTKRTAAVSVTLPASLIALLAGADRPASAQVVAAPGPSLRIVAPRTGDTLGANKFNLDVAYQSQSGAAVIAVEVWVDGVRWHRHTPEVVRARGTFRFELDASSLSGGTHTVVVKVFDARNARSETAIPIVAGNAAADALDGPSLAFVTPGNNKTVSGTVELSVEAGDRSGANPYVSLFIDDEFKTLKNFPPYTYAWDTTKAANGWHTVEAVGHGADSQLSTKRRLRVFVDNPGGATVRQPSIPDLGLKPAPRPAEAAPMSPLRPAPVLAIPLPEARTAAPARKAPGVRMARRTAPAASFVVSPAAAETVLPGTFARQAEGVPALAAPATRGGVRSAALHRAPAPSLAAPAPALPAAPAAPRVAAVARPAAPALRVAKAPARFEVLPATPAAARPASLSVPRAAARPASKPQPAKARPVVHRTSNALQVAFDGERIAFDVPPRVEAGLPFAPFRQIFEHTGGVVTWVPATQVVRAVNAEREIVLTVGKRDARVNDQKVTLERPAYLNQGRTIVPLSFVGKALDVNVDYDPATGRLQITSK